MIQFNTFKTGGVIYKITETEFVGKKKDFPKREMWVEVPTTQGANQKTELFKFEVIGDDVGSLDFFNEGHWLDIVFRIEGRIWKNPEGKEVLFSSMKIVDAKKGNNPFEEKKEMIHTPDDLSNTVVSDTGDMVKDWVNEAGQADILQNGNTLFDAPTEDEVGDLPF